MNEDGHQRRRPDADHPPDNPTLAEVPRRMSKARRPAAFTERDITRAIKGATKAGKDVSGARIERDGSIQLIFGPAKPVPPSMEANPWDA